ncbi:MAG TPA: hypothetical protein VFI25_15015 [Planctomycetota bacterium]|jgi:hypothetical protein|nr:hypothetical protein [Planctomycetota bacterium]
MERLLGNWPIELICFLLGIAGLVLSSAQRRRPLQNLSMLVGWSGMAAAVWLRQDQVMSNVRAEFAPLRNDLAEVLDRLHREPSPALLNILARIARKDVVAAEVLRDFEEFRSAAADELHATRRRWWVAGLHDRRTPAAEEEDENGALVRRVKAGEIADVRRLVPVPTPPGLDADVGLLKALAGTSRFEWRVWTGTGSPVSMDLLVSDECVLLALGGGAAAGPPGWAVRIRDPKAADALAEYFQRLWSHPKTVVVKPGKALSRSELDQAEASLRRMVNP